MAIGFVFLALAAIAIISLIRLAFKGLQLGFFIWLGAALMVLPGMALLLLPESKIEIASGVVFFFGFVFIWLGLYKGLAAVAKDKSPLAEQIQSKTVSDILHVAATRDSLIELLNYSLDRFLEILSLNSGAIHIHHSARNTLVMGAYRGLSPIYANKLELIQPGQTAIGRALQNKRVLIIRDLRISPDYEFFGGKAEGYSFLAVAPIMVENECWGVITLIGRKRYERGMLDISLLEQFGRQLGQALQVGRQNRQMALIHAQQNAVMGLYDRLFGSLEEGLSEKSLADFFNSCPDRPFAGKAFWLLKISESFCRMIYGPESSMVTRRPANTFSRQVTLPGTLLNIKPGQFFDIKPDEFSQLLPKELSSGAMLTGYGYGRNDQLAGLVIIDHHRDSISKNHQADITLIGNIFSVTFYQEKIRNLQSTDISLRGGGLPEIADELADLFAGISGNIQLLNGELQKRPDIFNNPNIRRWLKNLDDVANQGNRLIGDISKQIDTNSLIQSVLDSTDMDIVFHPDPTNPLTMVSPDKFKDIIGEVMNSAATDNRRLTLKTSTDNKSLTLTIRGETKPGFPSPELVQKARLHNIELRLSTDDIEAGIEMASIEKNHEGSINVVVAESREIIQRLLADLLANIGCSFVVKSSGSETLSYLEDISARGESVDAVIADMALEDIPGLHLCRQIKNIDNRIHTVVISSWGTHLPGSLLDESTVDAVLYKPFRLEQLRQVLPSRSPHNAPGN
jgi:CheY-like chemotaxis protein